MLANSDRFRSACRSLLQKAVRRGDLVLVTKVISCLQKSNDSNWLVKRTAVIAIEECWPLGKDLSMDSKSLDVSTFLVRVAQAVKMKDAAGLGTLALAFSTGDTSVLSGNAEDHHILVVSEAIKRPSDFWGWVLQNCKQEHQKKIVDVALKSYRKGGWPWDRAFMQAAAYLAIVEDFPVVSQANPQKVHCPVWIALDKHTSQGKKALRQTANYMGIPPLQLSWVSFYLESASTNEQQESTWWSKEVMWRLKQFELTHQEARNLWEAARPILVDILRPYEKELIAYLDVECQNLNDYYLNISKKLDGFSTNGIDRLESEQLNIFRQD